MAKQYLFQTPWFRCKDGSKGRFAVEGELCGCGTPREVDVISETQRPDTPDHTHVITRRTRSIKSHDDLVQAVLEATYKFAGATTTIPQWVKGVEFNVQDIPGESDPSETPAPDTFSRN